MLVLAPVSEGGCGVNHIGGTHELLHILGLAHVQNRADRCNYIDVNTDLIQVKYFYWRTEIFSVEYFVLRTGGSGG